MEDILAGLLSLNCVYFFLFLLGVGYTLVAAVLGGISEIDIPGIDVDIPLIDLNPGDADFHLELPFDHDISGHLDQPDVGLSPLSPITIATFITTFGGVGLIFNNLTPLHPLFGLIAATVSGLGVSALMFAILSAILTAMQGSSEVQPGDLVGRTAEASTVIGEGRIGEIVLVVRGTRTRVMARRPMANPFPGGPRWRSSKRPATWPWSNSSRPQRID